MDFIARFYNPSVMDRISPYISKPGIVFKIMTTFDEIKDEFTYSQIYQQNCKKYFDNPLVQFKYNSDYSSRNLVMIDGRGDGFCLFNSLYIASILSDSNFQEDFNTFVFNIKELAKNTIITDFDKDEMLPILLKELDSDVPSVELFLNYFCEFYNKKVIVINLMSSLVQKFGNQNAPDGFVLFNPYGVHFSLYYPLGSNSEIRNIVYNSFDAISYL